MVTDARTTNRNYPKNSVDNTVAEDFARAIDALNMIDADIASLLASVSQRAMMVHSHAIGDVSGLQTALEGKAASVHTHTLASLTDVDVGAVTNGQWLRRVAGKWQPAAISAGDVSGLGGMATESTSNYIQRANGAAVVPGWANDAGRPASPANGWIGYNADRQQFEGYQGGAWLPIGSAAARVEVVYSAATGNLSAGQTVFTVSGGYGVGKIDIIRNGVDLVVGTDVTASNGTTFTLTTAALASDVIKTRTYVAVQVLNKADVGLGNVDNTSDVNKPVSTATAAALAGKLDTSHVGTGGSAHAAATTGAAGFMSAADKTKLDGVATGASANSSDATLLARANHTGTQAISTVTGLQSALDGKVDVVETMAALKAIPDASLRAGARVAISGYSAAGDRGGGEFVVIAVGANPYPVDNNGLVIASAGAGFVFIRDEFLATGRISPLWFGADGKAATNQTTALNNWLACYDAINLTVNSGDTIADVSPWLYVPQGNFIWNSGKTWNPKCGFPTIRGDGPNSVLQKFTIALYNDLTGEAGSQQFPELSDFKIYNASSWDYGIVLGNPSDLDGSDAGRWSGVREGRIRNVIVTHCSKYGLFVVRDNHTRVESCTFNRCTLDGIFYIRGVDTEFLGCHAQLNTRYGVHIQPWAGNNSIGPFTGAGPGGLSWTDCNARYNGKGNFFATGGDPDTVILTTDTSYAGVSEIDFLGQTSIRIGNWWESYFHNCSWANITTGSPTPNWLGLTITTIAQDTTNTAEIAITLNTKHNFHRGMIIDNSMMQIAGTGMSYDTLTPRSGSAFVVKEVYSAYKFALNVAYTTAFSGTATLKRPQYDFVIKGQEKGYNPRNIFQIWFTGKNHNYCFFERCTEIDLSRSRLKLQVVLGADVLGWVRTYQSGIGPGAETDDTLVPIMGASADRAWFSQGIRRFDIAWRNWGAGTPVTYSNFGYTMDSPVPGAGLRTDHAYGAARYWFSVHWRPDAIVLGRHDAQNGYYRGWKIKSDGTAVYEVDGNEKITIDPATGDVSFAGRTAHVGDKASTVTNLPNVYMSPSSGQLSLYTGDAIVEEGSNTNGNWIKYASGLMICWSKVFSAIAVSTADGSGFQSAVQTWTFPTAYLTGEVPHVIGTSHGSTNQVWASARGVDNATAEGILFSFQSRTGRSLKMVSFGKWK